MTHANVDSQPNAPEASIRLQLHQEPKLRDTGPFQTWVIESFEPYIRRIAYGLARRSNDPVDDLIQVGTIGLLKALAKYDPNAGSSFKTYATYFITGEIRHYLRDKASMIKAPRQMYELYYRLNQIVQQLSDELGRTPTDLEIAKALDCPMEKVQQAQAIERRKQLVSLDQFALSGDENEEGHYLERLVDERHEALAARYELRLDLEEGLSQISEELATIIRLSYFEDLNQTEIASRLGISQMQVSRRLRKALSKMKRILQPSEASSL